MNDREPFPSTKRDWEYIARNSRRQWFALLRASRNVIHASTATDRKLAHDALCDAHDRLVRLGVPYVDDAIGMEETVKG